MKVCAQRAFKHRYIILPLGSKEVDKEYQAPEHLVNVKPRFCAGQHQSVPPVDGDRGLNASKTRGASFALSSDESLQIEKNLNQHLLNQQYVNVWTEDTQPLRCMRNGVELFSI